ncbi:MAG: glycosyltransferase family 4 protein [PVC group bacterium]
MQILFFSHYFPPEGNAPASRTYENCRRWVRSGHRVTVITCAPNVPDGKVYPGYRNRPRSREIVDGIEVIRVWTYLAPNRGTGKRILNFLSYMISAICFSLPLKKPRVIIATSPQFFCGWAGLIAARLRRAPFILEIRDLWPETIVAIGAMRNQRILRFLDWLARRMYAGADRIVAVGEGYRENLIRLGVPPGKVNVIHTGADLAFFSPRPPDRTIRQQYRVEGKYVCSYIGTLGLCSGLEVVPRAARLLKEMGREDIVIMLVGDGAIREKLEEICRQEGLDNVIFAGRRPKEEIPGFFAASDACLAHLKNSELFTTVLPSKFFEAAAMGKPVIMGVAGQAAALTERAGAGICIEPENHHELARSLIYLADHPEEAVHFGHSGRDYVARHHDPDELAGKYLRLIEEVGNKTIP